jgi:hypothetical protein
MRRCPEKIPLVGRCTVCASVRLPLSWRRARLPTKSWPCAAGGLLEALEFMRGSARRITGAGSSGRRGARVDAVTALNTPRVDYDDLFSLLNETAALNWNAVE